MKRRSRDDIVANILRAVTEQNVSGVTTYRIMSKAHISFLQAEQYLDMMIRAGLLEYDAMTHVYRITERGRRFLTLYSIVKEVMNAIDKALRDAIAE